MKKVEQVANYLINKYGISSIIGNEQLTKLSDIIKSKNEELIEILKDKFGEDYNSDYVFKTIKRRVVGEAVKLFDAFTGGNMGPVTSQFFQASGGGIYNIYENVYHDLIHHIINPKSYESFLKYDNNPGYIGTLSDSIEEDAVINTSSVWSGYIVPRLISKSTSIPGDASATQIVQAYQQALSSLIQEIPTVGNKNLRKILDILFRRVKVLLDGELLKASSVTDSKAFRDSLNRKIADLGYETTNKHFQITEVVDPELATKTKQFVLKYIAYLNQLNRDIATNW